MPELRGWGGNEVAANRALGGQVVIHNTCVGVCACTCVFAYVYIFHVGKCFCMIISQKLMFPKVKIVTIGNLVILYM
jgi:hypothetical protein